MWQIFVFSLVPLALVFMGVIGGSIHGKDSRKEVFKPPPTPSASSTGGPSSGGPPPTGIVLKIVAKDLAYNPRSLSAPPNTTVTVALDVQDPGIQHNFSLYKDNKYESAIAKGDIVTGPIVKNYTINTPAPGTYYFRCDVHPEMSGSFIVR
jgi:plastocyanin